MYLLTRYDLFTLPTLNTKSSERTNLSRPETQRSVPSEAPGDRGDPRAPGYDAIL